MNTCDTCKWWSRETDSNGDVTGLCGSPKMWENVNHDSPEHGCVVTDIGYVSFQCGPKFGCVHHEAKVMNAL